MERFELQVTDLLPSSSGLGRWPLMPVTRVQIPLGSPSWQYNYMFLTKCEVENHEEAMHSLQTKQKRQRVQ